MSATHALRPGEAIPGPPPRQHAGVWHVYRAERRKLSTQLATRLLALICVLGPFAFAGVLKIQTGSPADTLFGVWVHPSGFALSLVVLSFCGAWGFPVVAGVLAGDIFASEDRYGTWKMVLTRSSTRRDLFAGKVLAAMTFSVGLLVLLAVSSLAAGLLLVGAGRSSASAAPRCRPGTASCWWSSPGCSTCCRCSRSRASRCCSRSRPGTGSSA